MENKAGNLASDAKERALALDTKRSFIVQAPAGSGKTELLTQRILKLLSISEKPENILAITFTRKAASEMRSRITKTLKVAQQLLDEANDDAEKLLDDFPEHQRLSLQLALAALEQNNKHDWDLLENINRLQLKTIDSFCSNIVFQLPILSELGGQSAIEENASELFESACKSFLQSLEENRRWSPALMRVIQYLGIRSEQLQPLLVSLLQRRLQWADLVVDFQRNSRDNSLASLKSHMETAIKDIIESHFEKIRMASGFNCLAELDALAPFAASNLEPDNPLYPLSDFKHKRALDENSLNHWRLVCNLLFTTSDSLRIKVDKRIGFPANKESPFPEKKKAMETLLQELKKHEKLISSLLEIPQLPDPGISDDQMAIAADICECLSVLLAYLGLELQKNQSLDFSEIQLRAIHALNPERHDSALLALDSHINHILIDEYQDTSQSQLRLLENLVSDWHSQNDGKTLFLVGDPMQSIYRFREADVGIFIRAQDHGVGNVTLENLKLNCNFRSENNIVEWNNSHFSRCFPKQNNYQTGSVSYSVSQAFKQNLNSQALVNCNICLLDNDGEALPDTYYENLSDKILELLDKNTASNNDESIAVLIRSKKHAYELIGSFKRKNVPYQAVEIDLLNEVPHIINLCNLCAILLNPGDKLAWYAILRSSLVGLPNKDLLAIKQYCEISEITIASLFLEHDNFPALSTDIQGRISDIQHYFSLAFNALRNDILSIVVEKLWLALGGPATIDESNENDCKAFFKLLRKLESRHNNMDKFLIQKSCEQLFAAQTAESNNPVNIMTIHKAKGLEFDHVFIPGMEKRTRPDDKNLINWNIHLDKHDLPHLLLAPLLPKHLKNSKTSLYDYLTYLEKKRTNNENIRLLYVACTRAKKTMNLYAVLKQAQNSEGESRILPPPSGSLLSLLWDCLDESEINYIQTSKSSSPTEANNTSYQLKRIHPQWKNIELLRILSRQDSSIEKLEDNSIKSIFSKPEKPSIIGTINHVMLQQLVLIQNTEVSDLYKIIFESRQAYWENLIRNEGLFGEDDINEVLVSCSEILKQTLADNTNFWIFDNELEDSQCEQGIFCQIEDSQQNKHYQKVIIDRSFILDGSRWIIDYKTSAPNQSQTIDEFLIQESNQYRNQLNLYARAYSQMEKLPQKLALYFPRIKRLHLLN